jgi:hypothetical protein
MPVATVPTFDKVWWVAAARAAAAEGCWGQEEELKSQTDAAADQCLRASE